MHIVILLYWVPHSFLTSLQEYNCCTMLCQFLLYNKVNQLYVYIYPHISYLLRLPHTLPIPPLQVVTKDQADLPVLCCCFPLANYFHLIVYICQCYSLTSSQNNLPPPGVLKTILYVCVFTPVLTLGSSELIFFLDSIHLCQHTVFVFLFLTYFTLHDRFYVHAHHYK